MKHKNRNTPEAADPIRGDVQRSKKLRAAARQVHIIIREMERKKMTDMMSMAINDLTLENVTGGRIFRLKDGRQVTVELIEEYAELMRAGKMNAGTAYEFAALIGFPDVGASTFVGTDRYIDYWVTKQKELVNRKCSGLDAYRGLG